MRPRSAWLVLAALVATVVLAPVGSGQALAAPALVKDIEPGPGGSDPTDLASFGDAVYFGAFDSVHSFESWRSDGTEAGTRIFNENVEGVGFQAVGATLYFRGFDPAHGQELWRSDGTEAGTAMVKDIVPGPDSSFPRHVTDVGGTVLFDAPAPDGGRALWRTDGTEVGTALVEIVHPPEANFPLRELTAAGGLLFFAANDTVNGWELWRSDGTAAGTFMVKDIHPPFTCCPTNLIAFEDDIYFSACPDDCDLWRSDGTEAGTVRVKNINPGAGSGGPGAATIMGGALYFAADDGARRRELWRSDGTEAGTVLVADIRPGPEGSDPMWITTAGGNLLFEAFDPTHGRELWRSDGTASGTVFVEDINPGPADSSIQPGGDLGSEDPETFAAVGGSAFFQADDGSRGFELWRSDGTAAGTELVEDINPGPANSLPEKMTPARGRLFFSANEPTAGRELWALDVDTPPDPTMADLLLTLAADSAAPTIGSDVTFTISVRNGGGADATGVAARALLPAGLEFQSAVGGTYDPATGTWAIGSLANGATSVLTLVARATAPATFTAEISASDQLDPDSTPGNGDPFEDDQAAVTVTPQRPPADLSLTLAADASRPVLDSNVTLTARVRNDGPGEATGVLVRAPLSPGLAFVSADGPYDAATGNWALGSLAAGSDVTLEVVAKLVEPWPVFVTAQVQAANESDPDSVPGNDNPAEDDQATVMLAARGIWVNHNGTAVLGNDGRCTLIEAIRAANSDTASGAVARECASGDGADTIYLQNAETYTLTAPYEAAADPGPNGLPAITTDVTIEGRGSTIQRVAPDSVPFRILYLPGDGALTLRDQTLRGGRADGPSAWAVASGRVAARRGSHSSERRCVTTSPRQRGAASKAAWSSSGPRSSAATSRS